MTVRSLWEIVRRRWTAVIACLVVGALLGIAYHFVIPLKYTANTTMYVSAQGTDNAFSAYQGGLLSEQRASSYVELITGSRVAQDVLNDLKLPYSVRDLQSEIKASAETDSVVITVTVTDEDPIRAAAIANSIGRVFPEIVSEIEASPTPGRPPSVVLRVVEPATVPEVPSSLSGTSLTGIGIVLGLLAGIALALILDARDQTVKSTAEVDALLPAPSLADIPRFEGDDSSGLPDSQSAESFKQLRTNLQFVQAEGDRRVFLITSPRAGDGKSTVALNLAKAVGAAGQSVLLIEGDLRRPMIATYLGLETVVGLTSLLTGRVTQNQAIQSLRDQNVDFLASGPIPPNPSELLGSEGMADLISSFRTKYDMVIVDTPPIGPVADAVALAPSGDGIVLVVRWGKTTRGQVEEASRLLSAVGLQLSGSVLVGMPRRSGRKEEYHYYAQRGRPSVHAEGGNEADVSASTDTFDREAGFGRRPSPKPRG